MTTTANLGLTLMESSQAQPEIVFNENMMLLDGGTSLEVEESGDSPGVLAVTKLKFIGASVAGSDGVATVTIDATSGGGGGGSLTVDALTDITKITFDGPAVSVAPGATGEAVVTIDTVSGGGGGGAPSCARVKKATGQTVTNNTDTAVAYDTVLFDTDSYFSSGHFVAPFTGYFHVDASVIWDTAGGGVRILYFIVNGTTSNRIAGSLMPAATNACQTVSTLLSLTAGDTVAVHVFNDGGSNLPAVEELTTFSIHRV